MRRRTFKLSASFVHEMTLSRVENVDIRFRRYLYSLGFSHKLPIERHVQFDGSVLYVQDIPNDSLPTYDLVSMILLEGGFPKERLQDVLMRAWEENRDPVEIAREEVELVRRLE